MLTDGDYHELWVLAQLHHDEGIEDGVCRIKKFLEESAVCANKRDYAAELFSELIKSAGNGYFAISGNKCIVTEQRLNAALSSASLRITATR